MTFTYLWKRLNTTSVNVEEQFISAYIIVTIQLCSFCILLLCSPSFLTVPKKGIWYFFAIEMTAWGQVIVNWIPTPRAYILDEINSIPASQKTNDICNRNWWTESQYESIHAESIITVQCSGIKNYSNNISISNCVFRGPFSVGIHQSVFRFRNRIWI